MKKTALLPQLPKPGSRTDLVSEKNREDHASRGNVIRAEEAQPQPAEAIEATAVEATTFVLGTTSNWARHFMQKTSLREKVRPRNTFKYYNYVNQSK